MKSAEELKEIYLLSEQLRRAEIARNMQQDLASVLALEASEAQHNANQSLERLIRAKSKLTLLESDVLIAKTLLKVNTND